MGILTDFAVALTEHEQSKGISGGYRIGNGKLYPFYMTNEDWDAFKNDMTAAAKKEYGAGSGGELEEKDGKPPKMAAFFSSSRFVYLLSKDCPGFKFEKQLSTVVGGTANLDGYLCGEGRVVFVEAKCREPYGHKFPEKIRTNYRDVYDWLRKHSDGVFDCVMEDLGDRDMRTVFFARGDMVRHFDVKQMICHLLAIAAKYLRETDIPERIDFLYLLYDPSNLNVCERSRAALLDTYTRTCREANCLSFEVVFSSVVDYLIYEKGFSPVHAEKLKGAFCFTLCSQDDYREKLN